ncbi:glycosyltransferase [Sphingomonas sp. DG1-23]|uniref:glycosyltransferase n=1 Tax=Sphingomonas sp. DG1-23 TaxID=3068316 RepID=UPI00273FF43F|nr:glycosyltransferase [Sphingomonas sp. DG1-23]MDP5278765.1 glycosyltransferase [Sphingomonas sp. DG1-23]
MTAEHARSWHARGAAAQKRAVFFVFDGGVGLGHLRRLCHIAERMQGPFACLVVTGHSRAATWFVPAGCEYVHIPSWDSLIAERARYWAREPFVEVELEEAVAIRRTMIDGIMRAFRPDAIFVDHLPLGSRGELADVIENARCRKYLVTRGVLNGTEDLDALIFGGAARTALIEHYDRILVAADRRIVKFAEGHDLSARVRAKITSTGYVTQKISAAAIAGKRAERGLAPGDTWVVASAGGGQTGEATINAAIALADAYPELVFDIVLGPRSNLRPPDGIRVGGNAMRVRIHSTVENMGLLHAGADVVITTGGYNSLLETLQGSASIVCVPLRASERDEQFQHARSLSDFIDIRIAPTAAELPLKFAEAVQASASRRPDRRAEIDMSGADAIADIALNDLAMDTVP